MHHTQEKSRTLIREKCSRRSRDDLNRQGFDTARSAVMMVASDSGRCSASPVQAKSLDREV